MYIYANADGQIKEIVNDVYLRQSNDKINHIYLYIDSFSEAIYNNISVTYKLPDDSVVGPQVVSLTSKVKQTIPYDKKRDLRYFKDYQEYEFYDIEIPTVDHEHTLGLGNVLSQTGLVKCTISFIKTSGSFALQILPFYVEESVVRYAYNINSDEYNYLLQIVLAPQSDKYVTLKSEEKQQFSDGLKYFVNEGETSQIILHLTQGSHTGAGITAKEGTSVTSYNFNAIVTGTSDNLYTLSFPSQAGTLATTDFVSANPGGTFTNTLTSIRINGVDYGVSGGGGGSAIWGSIGGTLSNQTDLQNELNGKVDKTGITQTITNTEDTDTVIKLNSKSESYGNFIGLQRNTNRFIDIGSENGVTLDYYDINNIKHSCATKEDTQLSIVDGELCITYEE